MPSRASASGCSGSTASHTSSNARKEHDEHRCHHPERARDSRGADLRGTAHARLLRLDGSAADPRMVGRRHRRRGDGRSSGRHLPFPHRVRRRRGRVPRGRATGAPRADVPEPPADARVRGPRRADEADADDALRDDRAARHHHAVRRRGGREGRLRARRRAAGEDRGAMSMATRTDTHAPALHVADSHDVIRVQGARVNNLKDVSIEIPKRRLTVFTGVSGSGKSSLVFDTIAAESQRLINETYSAFVQGFMPTLARPEVDVLDGLTTAILVDQERMGGNPRSTVGTATDADAMLRILFSRLGRPQIGGPGAYSFNVASVHGSGGITVERGDKTRTEKASFSRTGGMCPRCEGRGTVNDFDLSALYDDSKSLNDGALTIPGYSMEGWYGRILRGCGFFDPDKPIKKFNKRELHDLLYKEPTKIKVEGINLTYAGLIPQIQKSFLSKDVDAMQPHVRAFVERAVVFTACPDCDGTRLSEAARSSKIDGVSIADVSAMQISDLAEWVRGLDEPSVAPLLETLLDTLDSFVEIGLGYLSLNRPSGTLSGGEAQRTRMIRHPGSSLTDVTYVFDEPTIGLHPHDIERMNDLLLQLRDKGNTVLVVHPLDVVGVQPDRGLVEDVGDVGQRGARRGRPQPA